MQQKVILKSGSVLMLDYTNFANSMELLQAVAGIINGEIEDFKLDSDFLKQKGKSLLALVEDNKTETEELEPLIKKMLGIITKAIADGRIVDIIIKCGDASSLDDRRINKELFEDVKQRQNMFEVLFNIAKYNLKPFFPAAAIK